MKIKSNFTLGLTTGVVLSLCLVLFISAQTEVSATSNLKGNYIGLQEADSIIGAYSTEWIVENKLPAETTIGGIIGRSNLESLTSQSESEYIKFRFYYTQAENGDPQIGLIFYPTENASAVLRTGSQSFCPTVCNTPE